MRDLSKGFIQQKKRWHLTILPVLQLQFLAAFGLPIQTSDITQVHFLKASHSNEPCCIAAIDIQMTGALRERTAPATKFTRTPVHFLSERKRQGPSTLWTAKSHGAVWRGMEGEVWRGGWGRDWTNPGCQLTKLCLWLQPFTPYETQAWAKWP